MVKFSTCAYTMEYRLIILTFSSILVLVKFDSVSGTAILSEKPDVIEVTEENQDEFALPVGHKLELDQRTKLYKPPPLSKNFTKDDRMNIQWKNSKTRYNYCKIGKTSDVTGWWEWTKTWLYTWCRDKDGEDMCCGNTRCSCNSVQANCACVSPKQFDYYEKKIDEDIDTYLGVADQAVDWYFATTPKSPADDKRKEKKTKEKKTDEKKTDEKKTNEKKDKEEPKAES